MHFKIGKKLLTIRLILSPFYNMGIRRLPDPFCKFNKEEEKFEYFYSNCILFYYSRRIWFTKPYLLPVLGKEQKVGWSFRIANLIINYWDLSKFENSTRH